jgi:hypothetical protein
MAAFRASASARHTFQVGETAGTDPKGDTSTLEDLSVLAKLRADEE